MNIIMLILWLSKADWVFLPIIILVKPISDDQVTQRDLILWPYPVTTVNTHLVKPMFLVLLLHEHHQTGILLWKQLHFNVFCDGQQGHLPLSRLHHLALNTNLLTMWIFDWASSVLFSPSCLLFRLHVPHKEPKYFLDDVCRQTNIQTDELH